MSGNVCGCNGEEWDVWGDVCTAPLDECALCDDDEYYDYLTRPECKCNFCGECTLHIEAVFSDRGSHSETGRRNYVRYPDLRVPSDNWQQIITQAWGEEWREGDWNPVEEGADVLLVAPGDTIEVVAPFLRDPYQTPVYVNTTLLDTSQVAASLTWVGADGGTWSC